MNPNSKRSVNYVLIFLLLIGTTGCIIFFIPALRRLKSDKLSAAQLQTKLTEQKQAVEGFQYPDEAEKRSWNDSKQRLKTIIVESHSNAPLFLNDELTKQATLCNITDIEVTPQSKGTLQRAPTETLPSGISENKSLFTISFHADYESLGQFLQWFDERPLQAAILSLNIKRGFPLVSVEIEVETRQFHCNF